MLPGYIPCSVGVGDFDGQIRRGRLRRGEELDRAAGGLELEAIGTPALAVATGGGSQRAEQLQRGLHFFRRLAKDAGNNNVADHRTPL